MTDATPIYLDCNASTPLDPEVAEVLSRTLRDVFGNPSSQHHRWGRAARDCVETARAQTASLLGASPTEIVFTSGATESCNLAIAGVAAAYGGKGNHVIASPAEHKAVLGPLKNVAANGFEVDLAPPDAWGRLTPERLQAALTPRTILVCAMAANNVLGTVNPVAELASLCKKRGVLFFCDATQALGKMPFSVAQTGVDLAALSGHKMYAPKGVGALYVRGGGPRVRLQPQLFGGGQERGLRGGTENVPGIAALGKACELAERRCRVDAEGMARLRDRFERALQAAIPGAEIVVAAAERLPNTSLVVLPDVRAERLLRELGDTLAASTGAACDSAGGQGNAVLEAIGLEKEKIAGAVRFSLGRFTTRQDIDRAVGILAATVAKVS